MYKLFDFCNIRFVFDKGAKSIKTDIEINKFVWNVGLTYSF